ncbi:MAG: homocysteine S-methyltransferase family protein [Alphaproteobacteria bacterium]
MSDYASLKARLDKGDVIILDGAIGTHLQTLGAPMDKTWAASGLSTHPDTTRLMHQQYIEAGADVITTNTFSSARHVLMNLGLADMAKELNIRAVALVQQARDRAARGRPVWIGAAVSNYGVIAGGNRRMRDAMRSRPRVGFWGEYPELSEEDTRASIREQAEVLVMAGADFLIAESTGTTTQRQWVSEACMGLGVPVWVGFKTRLEDGKVMSGYADPETFESGMDKVLPLGGEVMSIFHSSVEATSASIPQLRQKWPGPIAVYPDAGRRDYLDRHGDTATTNATSVADFTRLAKEWVGLGAQVIGACCGFGPEYIAPLRDALPKKIPGR